MKIVTVDADALRQVLQALIGPSYLMSELMAIQGLGDSPIDILVAQYNEAVKSHDETEKQS